MGNVGKISTNLFRKWSVYEGDRRVIEFEWRCRLVPRCPNTGNAEWENGYRTLVP